MFILLIIIMLGTNTAGGRAVSMEHLYYDSEVECNMAASTIERENNRYADYKLKAFCVRGD